MQKATKKTDRTVGNPARRQARSLGRQRQRLDKVVGRPTGLRAAAIKQGILDSATQEFLDHGYTGASMDRIAEASGTGKPTIYRHFGEKRRLFEIVCERSVQGFRTELRALADDPRPPSKVLPEFARILYDANAHRVMTSLGRIAVFEAIHAPEVSESIFGQAAETFRPIEVYLRRWSNAGILNLVDPSVAAAQFAAL